uniref:Uncharacterized protein n=1 Tax=Opuntia streptacantha TaxID=393608 RepID=A0A7C8ZVQ7_OPUST
MLKWIWRTIDFNSSFQHFNHCAHHWPRLRQILDTPKSHLHHSLCQFSILPWNTACIKQLRQLPLLELVICPPWEPLLAISTELSIKVSSPSNNLKEEHTITIHITFVGYRVGRPHLRSCIPWCPSVTRYRNMCSILIAKRCEPKICNFWGQVCIKKHIFWFYVVVNDSLLAFLVQIRDPLCSSNGYVL